MIFVRKKSGMAATALRVTSRNTSPPYVTGFSAVTLCIPCPRYNNASREGWKPLKCTAARRTQHAAHSSPQSTYRSLQRTTHHTTQHAWLNVVPPHGMPSEVGLQFFCFWLRGFYFSLSSHLRITQKSVVPAVLLSNCQAVLLSRN